MILTNNRCTSHTVREKLDSMWVAPLLTSFLLIYSAVRDRQEEAPAFPDATVSNGSLETSALGQAEPRRRPLSTAAVNAVLGKSPAPLVRTESDVV